MGNNCQLLFVWKTLGVECLNLEVMTAEWKADLAVVLIVPASVGMATLAQYQLHRLLTN